MWQNPVVTQNGDLLSFFTVLHISFLLGFDTVPVACTTVSHDFVGPFRLHEFREQRRHHVLNRSVTTPMTALALNTAGQHWWSLRTRPFTSAMKSGVQRHPHRQEKNYLENGLATGQRADFTGGKSLRHHLISQAVQDQVFLGLWTCRGYQEVLCKDTCLQGWWI